MVLATAQGSTNSSTAAITPVQRFAALLSDPIFAAIHNAFLIGSSLVELKGRVQLTACNSSLGAVTFDQSTSTFQSAASTAPPDGDTKQSNVIDNVLDGIVLQEVAQWLPAGQRDGAWLSSVLKSAFTQIVTLHVKRFPASSTTNTIYDLPSPPKDTQELALYRFPYLYPLDPFDYANVGITSIQDTSGGNNPVVASYVTNFKLYDVTRRALNCLTLLLDEATESLMPEIIDCYQHRLVQAIVSDSQIPTSEQDCTKIGKPKPDDVNKAVKILGNQVVRFLESWDSFLRESYYVETNPQNNDPKILVIDNAIELAAYEAGRSMAALSWNVSVATVPLEGALTPDQKKDLAIAQILKKKAQTTWQAVFNDRDINHIQYQVTALSTALDRAYYRVNPDIIPPSSDDPLAPLNPDLPSQAIQAVKRSLDYWQRTITRLCSPDTTTIKPALNPTSVTTSSGTSDPSRSLDWDLSKTLLTELIQQTSVWQSLILCQQGLQSFTMETVTQRILSDFMRDLEQAVRSELLHNRTLRWISLGVVAVIFGLILLLIIAGLVNKNFSPNGLLQSPIVIITAIGALIAPFVSGITSWLNKLGSLFGATGSTMEQALQHGYDQMLIEFDYLNHDVGITFPLIEFFLWEEIKIGGKQIQDGYDLLVNVFWTKADIEGEFQRVARAAFGPISAFINAQNNVTTKGKKGTNKPA